MMSKQQEHERIQASLLIEAIHAQAVDMVRKEWAQKVIPVGNFSMEAKSWSEQVTAKMMELINLINK